MTHAVNKLTVWLATVVAAGMVLLVSSAAHAHGSHAETSFGTDTVVEVLAARAVNADRAVPAVKSTVQEPKVWMAANPGGRADYRLPSGETFCCGESVSACATGVLAHVPSVLLDVQSCTTDDPCGAAALTGATLDGLMRPPRATTL